MPGADTSSIQSYLDFDLEIGPGKGREYLLSARSPAGEARATMRFPFDELALENRLDKLKIALLSSGGGRRQVLSPEAKAVQEFGRALFEALLGGEIGNRYQVSLAQAASRNKGLRLRLRIQPPEMAVLPWEYLYDPGKREFVCLSVQTPVVRYLEAPQPVQPVMITPPLRILGMIADPSNMARLDVGREKERLERSLLDLQRRGQVELHWIEEATWRGLQRALRGGPWHIFHFIGHGGFDQTVDEGLIALLDDNGQARPMKATELARLLADHRSLNLTVLNACQGALGSRGDLFSSTAAVLVQRGLPAVLAMQYEITDRSAIELSEAFYEALADGMPIDAAAAEARKAVSLSIPDSLEWGIPVLYMRTPDGVLFSIRPRKVGQQPVAPVSPIPPIYKPEAAIVRKPSPPIERPVEAVVRNEFVLSLEQEMKITLVRVSAGEFMMGSDPKKDASAFNAELPRHTVALELYYIGKYPVTVAQFSAFVNRTRYLTTAEKEGKSYTWLGGKWSWIEGANWRHPMGPDSNIQQKLDHPATHISWDDAVAFCRWASQVSGKHVHLPTEAEWEKAARGSVHIPVFRQQRTRPLKALSFRMNPLPDRIYPWGNEPPDQSRCNFSMNVKDTTPVNQYSPLGDSPYGCADMSGNVWEWTSSQYKPYPYQASDGREELEGGGWRVLRGGSFRNGARAVRCVYRDWDNPGYRGVNSGFRVAVTPEAITDRRSQ